MYPHRKPTRCQELEIDIDTPLVAVQSVDYNNYIRSVCVKKFDDRMPGRMGGWG